MKFIVLFILLGNIAIASQPHNNCWLELEQRDEAVIFGTEYQVPSLQIQIIDKISNKPVIPKNIDVFYLWDWFEYPATEHPIGVWDQVHEIVRCSDYQSEYVTIPAYTVKPKGWYNGIYTKLPWPRKPKFSHLEIKVYLSQCEIPRVIIEREELKKYRKKQAIWHVSCDSLVEISFTEYNKAKK